MEKKSTYGLTPEQLGQLLSVASEEADAVDSASEGKSEKGKPLGLAGRTPQIKGYEILGKLGEAGQGQIWRALQVSTSREVALKVPRAGLISSEKALARFEREVELAAALKHPNIAQIHDSGIHQGIYYYAMDLIEGMQLDEYVKENDLSQRQILELMQTICQAVQHAHQNGVIHRDLKPSNIVVTAEGVPYIVDFGLAKNLLEDDVALTVSIDGEAAGTPAYMSPEQAAGHIDKLDTRTDVYSLGVILFTLLTGESPHDLSGSRLEVMRRIAEEEARRPRKICLKVDKELEFLLLKALANNPDKRYTTAGELARDIDNYLRSAPLIAGPESGVYHIKKFIRRHRAFVVGVAVVLVVLVAGVVVSMLFAIGQARARAEAQAVTDFLTDELLVSTNPFTDKVPEVTLLSVLDAASEKLKGKFEDKPLVEARIRLALGQAYWRHGKHEEAQVELGHTRRIYQQELGEQDPKTLESMLLLGLACRRQGRNEQAQSLYYKVVEGARSVSREEEELTFSALNELAQIGIEQYRNGAYEKAVATLTNVERYRNMLGDEAHISEVAFLAMTLHQLGRDREAQATFNRWLGRLEGPVRAAADFIFAVPTNVGLPVNRSAGDGFPCVSSDNLSLYFGSDRPEGLGGYDLYVTTRKTKTDPWGPPANLGPTVNSSSGELTPRISADGLSLFFNSDRPGGYGGWDIYMVTRATIDDDWGEPVKLGLAINSSGNEGLSVVSADGLSLFLCSDRPGGYGVFDTWVTKRATIDDEWGEPVNLGPPVNTSASDMCMGLSADELSLFLSTYIYGPTRRGEAGGCDLWVSTRSMKDEPWQEPVNLGPTINSWADELLPYISADGSTLYFTSSQPGGFGNFDLWEVSLVPIVDTNHNGKVDLDDLCILAEHRLDNH